MRFRVIALRRKSLYRDKQQGRHRHVIDTDVVGNRVDVLLPGNVELTLHQELKQRHRHDAEGQQQGPNQAIAAAQVGQAVGVQVITQQDVAVIVGKGAKHVVAILRGFNEYAMLVGNERRQDPQGQYHLYPTLADGINALAHQWQSHIDDQQHIDIPQQALNGMEQD